MNSGASDLRNDGFRAFRQHDQSVHHKPGQPTRVLLVEDDPKIRHKVANYLEEHNMHVVSVSQRQDVMRQFALGEPGLVILDLRLHQENGFDLLREIRSRSNVPLIVTSGQQGDEADRVVGLELGADDCLSRPFGLRELLARIRAVLRRRKPEHVTSQWGSKRGRYRFGGWEFDGRSRRLTAPNGDQVALTKGEYALLVAFLDAPRQPLTRLHLLQATHLHDNVFDRSLDVQVSRLRRKLEAHPNMPRAIQTERGIGYLFALPVEPL